MCRCRRISNTDHHLIFAENALPFRIDASLRALQDNIPPDGSHAERQKVASGHATKSVVVVVGLTWRVTPAGSIVRTQPRRWRCGMSYRDVNGCEGKLQTASPPIRQGASIGGSGCLAPSIGHGKKARSDREECRRAGQGDGEVSAYCSENGRS